MDDFKAKFDLTIEENVFVVRRNLIDYIWKSAKLEGLRVTFSETEAICNGMSVPNVEVKEIIIVNNLKHAWQFLLNTLDFPMDFSYICKINKVVGGDNLIYNSGFLRDIPVSISGTKWKPKIPTEAGIGNKLREIGTIQNITLRSIELMLYCMRTQMFVDGNKRTAMLAANHEMIKGGCGVISVPIEYQTDFIKLLVEFYETGSAEIIRSFVYNRCIDGLDLRTQEEVIRQAQRK